MPSTMPPAVVLLSGGLDSATTLAIARYEGFACHALSFDYGQRHRIELDAAAAVAKSLGAVQHVVMNIDLRAFGGSALTAEIDVPKDRLQRDTGAPGASLQTEEEHIPITYVPARNTIFLSFALGYAEVLECTDIFIGVNAVDYSGYPDCRPDFIQAFETMANLATRSAIEGKPIRIRTPLMQLSKADIIRRGNSLGVDYALTVSCYQADEQGRACGKCDSCRLRQAGFVAAGVPDPTRYRPR